MNILWINKISDMEGWRTTQIELTKSLRKRGHNVTNKDDRYYLLSDKPTEDQKPTNKTNNKALIPKGFRSTFKALSESDKADCIDMLRKSLYYYKSALSLLESNKEVLAYVSSIEGEI